MNIDKINVTNRRALQGKYGTAGLKKIQDAIKQLVIADSKRNLKTVLIFLDDAIAMKKAKGKAVFDPTDTEQIKNAIDSLFDFYLPDYIMILGSTDVVPHCQFRIPIPGDDDTFTLSDVPYACHNPFSRTAG